MKQRILSLLWVMFLLLPCMSIHSSAAYVSSGSSVTNQMTVEFYSDANLTQKINSVKTGEYFYALLSLRNFPSFFGMDLRLKYNPAIAQLASFDDGSLVNSTAEYFEFYEEYGILTRDKNLFTWPCGSSYPELNTASGTIRFSFMHLDAPYYFQIIKQEVVLFKFKALKSGKFSINLNPDWRYPQGYNCPSKNGGDLYVRYECSSLTVSEKDIPVTSINILQSLTNLKIGETKKLNAVVYPNNASTKKVSWFSSDPSVATVDANGIVSAKSQGEVTISAIGVTASSKATVSMVIDPAASTYEYYCYSFLNNETSFGYSSKKGKYIPLGSYTAAGIEKNQAQLLMKQPWNGNCLGMAMSSMLFREGLMNANKYLRNLPWEIKYPKDITTPNSKLKKAIEILTASQYNNNLFTKKKGIKYTEPADFKYELDKAMAAELENHGLTGQTALLVLKTTTGKEHAVVLHQHPFNGNYYYVYDPSGYINSLQLYSKGYKFGLNDDKYEWKIVKFYSIDEVKDIFNSLYYYDKNEKVFLASTENETTYTYLVCPVADLTISNELGQTATILNGDITGEIEDIRLIPSSILAETPTYTIILPTDTYTIVGSNDEVITTSFADDYMSASVTAKSSTPITISSDLKEISVDTAKDEEYDITYTVWDNIFDEMNLVGTATGTVTTTLNDANISILGANTLSASASVSDLLVSANSDNLADSDEITVRCEKADNGTTLQILGNETELTEKTALPERLSMDAPAYDLESGSYEEGQQLTFTDKDDETIIYYTTDGSEPTKENGIIYSLPIDINQSMTVKAIATKYGYLDSDVITLEYTLPEVSAPVANYISGEYNTVLSLELSSDDPANEIYYTLDGSDPFENGILYTVPIHLFEDTTVKAYTLQNGCVSDICEYDYTITHQLPFYFENTALNQNYELITLDNLSSLTEVTLSVTKLLDGEQTGAFSIAFYDENDKLISVSQAEATITQNNETVRVPIAANTSGAKKMKVFVWDSALKPLGEIQAHKFSEAEQ